MAMAAKRALRDTRCLVLDFNYISFLGFFDYPLAGMLWPDIPAGQLCGTQY
jgi:hypothetical protein